MDSKTKTYATYALLIAIVIVMFSIDNKIAGFIAVGALIFLGIVIENIKTKE